MSEWKEILIDSACSRLSSGKAISSSLIKDKGYYPVYGGNGIRGFTNTYNFDGECAIIGRQGASCGNVRYFSGKAYMTEHAVVAVPTKEHNAYYLSCVLASLKLGRLSGQSAQPGIGVGLIGKQNITMPSLATQQKIASILSSLDDKIAVNRRICENLEAQAQALFKHWFIDFAPFKNGQFVESELGMIPEGWRVESIGKLQLIVTDYVANGSFASLKENVKLYQEEYAYFIRNTDLKSGKFGVYVDKHSYEFLSKSRLFGGEIIISNVGDVGSVFLCPHLNKPMTLGNNIIMVKSEDAALNAYLYLLFRCSFGQGLIRSITGGSAQPKFNKTDFKSLKIVMPPKTIIANYVDNLLQMINIIEANKQESTCLATLRDTLLPKLMSGQIKV